MCWGYDSVLEPFLRRASVHPGREGGRRSRSKKKYFFRKHKHLSHKLSKTFFRLEKAFLSVENDSDKVFHFSKINNSKSRFSLSGFASHRSIYTYIAMHFLNGCSSIMMCNNFWLTSILTKFSQLQVPLSPSSQGVRQKETPFLNVSRADKSILIFFENPKLFFRKNIFIWKMEFSKFSKNMKISKFS